MTYSRDQKGFTLVEVLVVMALIALLSIFALPGITNVFRVSLNSAAREMAATVKEAYNASALTGRVYRLVYDFKERQYWVESGPATSLLETADSREKEKQRTRLTKKEKPKDATFSMDRDITKSKKNLPRGVEFEDILTEQSPEPLKEGTAYTHFFPHGVAEQTIIHLKDSSKNQNTLVILPVTGRTRLFSRFVKKEDINGE